MGIKTAHFEPQIICVNPKDLCKKSKLSNDKIFLTQTQACGLCENHRPENRFFEKSKFLKNTSLPCKKIIRSWKIQIKTKWSSRIKTFSHNQHLYLPKQVKYNQKYAQSSPLENRTRGLTFTLSDGTCEFWCVHKLSFTND